MLFEVASELVKSPFELHIVAIFFIFKVKVEKSFFSSLPLVSFAITLQSDFFEESVLDLLQSFFRNVIFWRLKVPAVDQQLFKILYNWWHTDSLSEGMQKFSSA